MSDYKYSDPRLEGHENKWFSKSKFCLESKIDPFKDLRKEVQEKERSEMFKKATSAFATIDYLSMHHIIPTAPDLFRISSQMSKRPLNRIDLVPWEYTINFLLNFCQQFNLRSSEQQEEKALIESSLFREAIEYLPQKEISYLHLEDLIRKNKPLLSFLSDNNAQFRKNILFIKVFTQVCVAKHKKWKDRIELIAKHWLTFLMQHESFRSLKCCTFFTVEYYPLSDQKISFIKAFNEEFLEEIRNLYSKQGLNFTWLDNIKKTYTSVFGSKYTNAAVKPVDSFKMFSRSEIDMFLFILSFNISISEGFPIHFEQLINEELNELGIADDAIQNIMSGLL